MSKRIALCRALLTLLIGAPILCIASGYDSDDRDVSRDEYSLRYLDNRLGNLEADLYRILWKQKDLKSIGGRGAEWPDDGRRSAEVILSFLDSNDLQNAERMLRDEDQDLDIEGWAGVLRAERYRRIGRTALARTLFLRALRSSNERLVEAAYIGMAQLSSDTGDWEKAIDWYEKADASLSERIALLVRVRAALSGEQSTDLEALDSRKVRNLFRLAGHAEDEIWEHWLNAVSLSSLLPRVEVLALSKVEGAADQSRVALYRERLMEVTESINVMYARELSSLDNVIGEDLMFLLERSSSLHRIINLHIARHYEKAFLALRD